MKFKIEYNEIDPFEPRQYWESKTRYANAPEGWTEDDVWDYYADEYQEEMELISIKENGGYDG